MSDRILLIANPTSGGGRGKKVAEQAFILMQSEGRSVRLFFTKAKGDAANEVRQAIKDQVKCVVACGGDGTIHEMINVMPGTDITLGLLPCGRGNDLARALHIPFKTEKAVAVILGGRTKRIDLGKVDDHYFATVVTMGFDSEVARLVYEKAVPFTGTAAYILGVIKTFRTFRGIRLRMTGDFGSVDQPVLLTATANTSSYGGGIKILPEASPTDGWLDVCHARMMSRSRIMKLLVATLWGGHVNNPHITIYRTRTLMLETDTPVVLFADGEPVSKTPAVISVVPQVLSVYTP